MFWLPLARSEYPCQPAPGPSSSAAQRAPRTPLQSDPASPDQELRHRKHLIDTSIRVGKYLVSPLTRHLGPGRYAASVSIRSGRGSATHDRVMRFIPEFDSGEAALHYATAQGLDWIGSAAASQAVACPALVSHLLPITE
jgi:hypothetical protein